MLIVAGPLWGWKILGEAQKSIEEIKAARNGREAQQASDWRHERICEADN